MPDSEGGSPVVGQWGRFEVFLDHAADYADPYRDVTLPVTFQRPDGSTVAFWGFYDGAATWRLRFMPDQEGLWTYAARFSDGSGGAEGEFLCTKSVIPGMLATYAPNPVWFGFREGGPLLARSFHVGDRFFAANFGDVPRRVFLDWVEAQGYNTLSIASHYLNRDAPGRGQGWETPRLWPLDAGEFRKLERVLDDLAARQLMVFPFAGFFGRLSNAPQHPDDQELYIRYVLARLGAYWNILLNVGGPEPTLPHSPYMTPEEVNRLGSLIASLDVFDHPLTVHNPTGDDAFIHADWLDFTTLQGPKTTDLEVLSAGLLRNHAPRKPLFAQETLWSGNQYHPDYSDAVLRRNAYVLLMSAAAINFADNGGPARAGGPTRSGGPESGTLGDSSSGFSGSLDPRDARQGRHDILKRVWDCLETLPYHRMVPRQDLVDRGFCLCDAGAAYLVYLPDGGAVNVAVEPGSFAVEWINARDPADRRDGGVTADGQGLVAPRDGDLPGEDWLVYLHARDVRARVS